MTTSVAAACNTVPEIDILKALVANVERCREGKESTATKPAELESNVRIWGKPVNERKFRLNEDGTATYFVRFGETVRAITTDILREIGYKRSRWYEPSYQELTAAIGEVKSANPNIADFDLLDQSDAVVVPAALVSRVLAR